MNRFLNALVHSVAIGLLVLTAVTIAGCASGGKLALSSVNPDKPASLSGNFTTAIYGYDDRNTLHVLLIEGPADNPTQAVHVQMFWGPRAGRTPLDTKGTNATVRYMVFPGRSVGVYAGAGYLWPNTPKGKAQVTARLYGADLRLVDASTGFSDKLGPAVVDGSFSATRDDQAIGPMIDQLNKLVTAQLGYPRLIGQADSVPLLAAK